MSNICQCANANSELCLCSRSPDLTVRGQGRWTSHRQRTRKDESTESDPSKFSTTIIWSIRGLPVTAISRFGDTAVAVTCSSLFLFNLGPHITLLRTSATSAHSLVGVICPAVDNNQTRGPALSIRMHDSISYPRKRTLLIQ
jgi:hypothetical protein